MGHCRECARGVGVCEYVVVIQTSPRIAGRHQAVRGDVAEAAAGGEGQTGASSLMEGETPWSIVAVVLWSLLYLTAAILIPRLVPGLCLRRFPPFLGEPIPGPCVKDG